MHTYKEVKAVALANLDFLMQLPNVVGVGVTKMLNDWHAIVLYVTHIDLDNSLPSQIDNEFIVIESVGTVVAGDEFPYLVHDD